MAVNTEARMMLVLKKANMVAFAELENRSKLEQLRKLDPRMKRGRIHVILQCYPSQIEEGTVYDKNGVT